MIQIDYLFIKSIIIFFRLVITFKLKIGSLEYTIIHFQYYLNYIDNNKY